MATCALRLFWDNMPGRWEDTRNLQYFVTVYGPDFWIRGLTNTRNLNLHVRDVPLRRPLPVLSILISCTLPCHLTLILLTWRIWWDHNKASKWQMGFNSAFNPLNAELNPIYHLLALLWAHHILHVSRIRVKGLMLCTVCDLKRR